MKKPANVKALEDLGRVQLSETFFMRDFLYSEVSNLHGIPNIPTDPDLAIKVGRRLCEELLEPLQSTFGRIAVRSSYRSPEINAYGNENYGNFGNNENNAAAHIWDSLDGDGCMGATACVIVPWFSNRYSGEGDWRKMAWWIHDHLPYSEMVFFPKLFAFNLQWHERPARRINSFAHPRGLLTKRGMENHEGDHSAEYGGFPTRPPV